MNELIKLSVGALYVDGNGDLIYFTKDVWDFMFRGYDSMTDVFVGWFSENGVILGGHSDNYNIVSKYVL